MPTNGLVKFDRNCYFVPVELAGKRVTAKGYPLEVELYHRGGKEAHHKRRCARGETFMELEHYLSLLVKKPRSLYNADPLKNGLPPALDTMKNELLSRGEDRQMAKILRLALYYGMDELEQAAPRALSQGHTAPRVIEYYLGQNMNPAPG